MTKTVAVTDMITATAKMSRYEVRACLFLSTVDTPLLMEDQHVFTVREAGNVRVALARPARGIPRGDQSGSRWVYRPIRRRPAVAPA